MIGLQSSKSIIRSSGLPQRPDTAGSQCHYTTHAIQISNQAQTNMNLSLHDNSATLKNNVKLKLKLKPVQGNPNPTPKTLLP